MILRRVMEHVKAQNWTAVALDFVIVVVGVFIGIQVSNWNDEQATRTSYAYLQRQLIEETKTNISRTARFRERWEEQLAGIRGVIDILRSCEGGEENRLAVERGLDFLQSSPVLSLQDTALNRLTEDESLLALQSSSERAGLMELKNLLNKVQGDFALIGDVLERVRIDQHPRVGYGELGEPARALNTVDERLLTLEAPIGDVCADPDFVKPFYLTERMAVFLIRMSEYLEEELGPRLAAEEKSS